MQFKIWTYLNPHLKLKMSKCHMKIIKKSLKSSNTLTTTTFSLQKVKTRSGSPSDGSIKDSNQMLKLNQGGSLCPFHSQGILLVWK